MKTHKPPRRLAGGVGPADTKTYRAPREFTGARFTKRGSFAHSQMWHSHKDVYEFAWQNFYETIVSGRKGARKKQLGSICRRCERKNLLPRQKGGLCVYVRVCVHRTERLHTPHPATESTTAPGPRFQQPTQPLAEWPQGLASLGKLIM